MKVWVLIPAYNEELRVGGLLHELKKRNLSTLVVDDGSRDNTYAIAKEYADVVLRNEKNLGKGLSLRKGIMYLLHNVEFDYVVTMDADNQHSPFDLDTFLEKARSNEAFVIGNRLGYPEGMPFIRICTNRTMSWLVSRIAKQDIPDTQCGFRLIRRDVLESVQIQTNKFEVESELIIEAARKNFTITSIPIKSIYYKYHSSKINPILDTIRFIRFITKINHD